MSKKSLRTDDLIHQLTDTPTARVSVNFSPVIEELVGKFAESFLLKLEGLVREMWQKFFSTQCEPLKQKIATLLLSSNNL